MDFRTTLKTKRQELGLTLDDVGRAVGVSKATVQRWESGEIKSIRGEKLGRLATVLQCSPNDLMDWDDAAEAAEQAVRPGTLEYALYGQAKELDEEEKQQLLDLARLMAKKRKEFMGE